jgi:hypothetical protein
VMRTGCEALHVIAKVLGIGDTAEFLFPGLVGGE